MQQPMIMVNPRPQEAYRKQGVLTASPIELIVMLYDGLKKNLVMGQRAIKKHDIQGSHKYLMKSQDIVTELVNSLDMSFPISKELLEIYDFVLRSIEDANIHKNPEPIGDVLEIVENLRDAWQQISLSNRGSLHMGEEQA